MYKITITGAGQMAAPHSFPVLENGHEVSLVGTPVNRAVISSSAERDCGLSLGKTLHSNIRYFQSEEVHRALEGAVGSTTTFPEQRMALSPMLEHVAYSFAVKNTEGDLHQYAHFVAESDNSYGVLQVMDAGLANRGYWDA